MFFGMAGLDRRYESAAAKHHFDMHITGKTATAVPSYARVY